MLSVRNLSSLPAPEVALARRAMEAELKSRGARLQERNEAAARVGLVVSQSFQSGLLVAEARFAEKREVAMAAFTRPTVSASSAAAQRIVLVKEFLWEQARPLLDIAFGEPSRASPQVMFVLEPDRMQEYRREGNRWQPSQAILLGVSGTPRRDLWGRLVAGGEGMEAHLGRSLCRITLHPFLAIVCQDIATGGLGTLEPAGPGQEKRMPDGYSEAALEADGMRRRVATDADGEARLYEEGPVPVATFSGWGSELASVRSGCGSGWQLLVTRPGDWTEPDAVTAYTLVERQAVAVSQPVELSGPVLRLRSEPDSQTAVSVVRNLETGHYEVYRLSISCAR